MKKIILPLALIIWAFSAKAQSVTFSEHIAPIVYKHCTSCHRPGEIGPFSLTSYNEVSSWGTMIKYVTSINYMPPWKPDPNYRKYQKENYLSATQKQQIVDWVDQGMPQGNPSLEPPLPVFPSGSQVGVPDKVVSFSQKHMHPGNNQDEYRYFVIPTGLTETKKIRSLEFRPGNTRIVHHALIWEDTTGAAAAADALTPEYGYSGNQGPGANLNQQQLPGYVPGSSPVIYKNGITQLLHDGSDLKLQLHYAPSAVNESDSSSINIFYESNPTSRLLQTNIMLPLPSVLVNGPFIIPANSIKEFHGKITVPFEASLFSVAPHCHILGTHWKVYAVKPNGDTIPLINIKKWDFNWQGSYQFKQLLRIPAGSVIHAFAGYDNTVNNINNPHNPPITISWGEGTGDEMYYLPISYLPYQQGDENLVFEDSITTSNGFTIQKVKDKLYPVSPVPAHDIVRFGYTLETPGKVSLKLIGTDGKLKRELARDSYHLPGYHTRELSVSDLPKGIYYLEFTKGANRQVQKFVVSQ
jgi:hypothetical protein